jgi:hypothetical protein
MKPRFTLVLAVLGAPLPLPASAQAPPYLYPWDTVGPGDG